MHKPETIESWLEQLGQPSADRDYKPGHQRMHDLLVPLNLKRPKLRIRIAGTNGKGSTAFMLAVALQTCGLKLGLYTSPHIHHFNERIRINGEPISNDALLSLIEAMMPEALAIGASYFEMATALALKHFSDSEVDVEILEAGVGARLDATTAVDADMALITPIGLDHQAWLGDTLELVAMEKAYAMLECSASISAPQTGEVESILCNFSPKMHIADMERWPNLTLQGEHQQTNASLALAAIKELINKGSIECDIDRARSAITAAQVPGRLQRIEVKDATIWLDAAHNHHAVEALLPTLKMLNLDSIMVFTREDRDLSDSLELLRNCATRVVGDKGDGLDHVFRSVVDALKHELNEKPNGNHLVLGSFITVAAALNWLRVQGLVR